MSTDNRGCASCGKCLLTARTARGKMAGMDDPVPVADGAVTATAQLRLSPAQMKLLLHLQMLQKQTGDGVTQIVLNVSRGRIELIDSRPLQRIVFS